jgi:hypothetical protein
MVEPDVLSSDIDALKAQQREAWRELASSTLTAFDRRELRNRIRQSGTELRDHLNVRTERLRPQPRPIELPATNPADIGFRLL